ncbi:hypothetical protein [Roseivivax sp. CAU 1753]
MRIWPLLLLLLALTGCNTGGPGFSGIEPVRVSQDGSTFLFRGNGALIEAQRVSVEFAPRFQPVARKAGIAAQIRTGCPVEWIVGDQAMMILALACPGAEKPPKLPRGANWICDVLGASRPVGERMVSSTFSLSCRKG